MIPYRISPEETTKIHLVKEGAMGIISATESKLKFFSFQGQDLTSLG